MESSKSPGVTEECSSSESGWTLYIASPVHEQKNYDSDDDDDDDDDVADHDDDYQSDDHGSDDSMTSDASSGPSYLATLQHGRTENEGHGKKSSKKAHKQVEEEKLYNRKIKGEKEELGHKANKAAGCGYGGRKVRKPN